MKNNLLETLLAFLIENAFECVSVVIDNFVISHFFSLTFALLAMFLANFIDIF